jgi:hypothetical protein
MQDTWGQLLSISATQEQPADLQAAGAAAPQDPASATSALQGDAPPSGRLGAGSIAGIAVGCAAFVTLAAAAVWMGLRRRRGADASKGALLAYMNEMTEADLELEGDGDGDGRVGVGGAQVGGCAPGRGEACVAGRWALPVRVQPGKRPALESCTPTV